MENFNDWNFNLRMYITAYRNLGYSVDLCDWNVRYSPGRLVLDNHSMQSSTNICVEDGLLDIEVRPWNSIQGKRQNIDLLEINSGWRNSYYGPEKSPSPQAVAFLEHLFMQGYCERPMFIHNDDVPTDEMDIPCY
jgi:hypothetical protein